MAASIDKPPVFKVEGFNSVFRLGHRHWPSGNVELSGTYKRGETPYGKQHLSVTAMPRADEVTTGWRLHVF